MDNFRRETFWCRAHLNKPDAILTRDLIRDFKLDWQAAQDVVRQARKLGPWDPPEVFAKLADGERPCSASYDPETGIVIEWTSWIGRCPHCGESLMDLDALEVRNRELWHLPCGQIVRGS
jgi:hypothetical protein